MKRLKTAPTYGLLVASLAAALVVFAVSAVGAFANGGMGGGTGGGGTGGGGAGGGGAGGAGGPALSPSSDQISEQARAFFNEGVTYGKQKKWYLAIAAYKQAVHIDPKFAAAWTNLGHSYRKTQQYDMALDAYKQAIGLAPDDPYPHGYLALTYLAMGNKDAAMHEYEIVRRLDEKMAGELLKAIQANNPDLGDEE
jgi:tetratricopeptide (TPR) repeat protein